MAATFTVEDGTGLATANSYISEADADQYNDDHEGNATWTAASQAAKEKALRLATQYLDAVYGPRWKGARHEELQALDWPRDGADDGEYSIDNDVLPQPLLDACVELAIKSAGGTSLIADPTEGNIKRTRSKVGSLESEKEYMGGLTPYNRYRLVDSILRPILNSGGAVVRVDRG